MTDETGSTNYRDSAGGRRDHEPHHDHELDDELEELELSDEDLEALREMVMQTLTGGDPDLLAELLGETEFDEGAPESLSGSAEGTTDFDAASNVDPHQAALDEAQQAVEAERMVQEINRLLLDRAPEHKFDPKLDRVVQLLDILGDPQDAYTTIHVAGTNGKTSVTRMVAALLTEMGLRTGSFTSPHLVDVRERIEINGKPISAGQFVFNWEDIATYVEMVDLASEQQGEPKLSYFELLAVLAIVVFADTPVDTAVFEAGMGGRWDATNVVDAGVQVITPIALDHQDYLGDTLSQIAAEKAAIIKDKSVVVVMTQDEEALAAIEKQCQKTDSIMWLEGRDWKVLGRQPGVGGQMVDIQTPAGVYEGVFVPVHGAHQAHNAAAALVAVEAMLGGKPLAADVVDEGFAAVRTPGRLEVVRRSPTIVLDGAHNPAGVEVLRAGLEEAFRFDVTIGVFSAMADKNIEQMLVEMEPDLESIVLVRLGGERAAELEDLKVIAEDVFGDDRVFTAADLASAVDKAVELADAPEDQTLTRGIVVFGSLYLVGEATALLHQ